MPGLVYTTLRHNYIAKISIFQVATNGSEAWTLKEPPLQKRTLSIRKYGK